MEGPEYYSYARAVEEASDLTLPIFNAITHWTDGDSPIDRMTMSMLTRLDEEGKDEVLRVYGPNGRNLLQSACQFHAEPVVLQLLEWGADAQVRDEWGATLLHITCSSPNPRSSAIMQAVLDSTWIPTPDDDEQEGRYGLKVEATDVRRCTALHYAAGSGDERACAFLLSRGVPVAVEDLDGRTALFYAQAMGSEKAAKTIEQYQEFQRMHEVSGLAHLQRKVTGADGRTMQLLPRGFERILDPISGKYFYRNSTTGEQRWETEEERGEYEAKIAKLLALADDEDAATEGQKSKAQEKLARQKEARRKAQEEFNALVYFEQLVERRIAPLEKASAMMEADKYRSNLDKSRKRTAEHKKHIEEKQREEEEERERVKAIEEKKKREMQERHDAWEARRRRLGAQKLLRYDSNRRQPSAIDAIANSSSRILFGARDEEAGDGEDAAAGTLDILPEEGGGGEENVKGGEEGDTAKGEGDKSGGEAARERDGGDVTRSSEIHGFVVGNEDYERLRQLAITTRSTTIRSPPPNDSLEVPVRFRAAPLDLPIRSPDAYEREKKSSSLRQALIDSTAVVKEKRGRKKREGKKERALPEIPAEHLHDVASSELAEERELNEKKKDLFETAKEARMSKRRLMSDEESAGDGGRSETKDSMMRATSPIVTRKREESKKVQKPVERAGNATPRRRERRTRKRAGVERGERERERSGELSSSEREEDEGAGGRKPLPGRRRRRRAERKEGRPRLSKEFIPQRETEDGNMEGSAETQRKEGSTEQTEVAQGQDEDVNSGTGDAETIVGKRQEADAGRDGTEEGGASEEVEIRQQDEKSRSSRSSESRRGEGTDDGNRRKTSRWESQSSRGTVGTEEEEDGDESGAHGRQGTGERDGRSPSASTGGEESRVTDTSVGLAPISRAETEESERVRKLEAELLAMKAKQEEMMKAAAERAWASVHESMSALSLAHQHTATSLAETLRREAVERREAHNRMVVLQSPLRVNCRIRPRLSYEVHKQIQEYVTPSSEGRLLLSVPRVVPVKRGKRSTSKTVWKSKVFKFDAVFSAQCSQRQIFMDVRPLVQSSVDGYSSCILCFGHGRSGKTFSLLGRETSLVSDDVGETEKGIAFRVADEIFRLLALESGDERARKTGFVPDTPVGQGPAQSMENSASGSLYEVFSTQGFGTSLDVSQERDEPSGILEGGGGGEGEDDEGRETKEHVEGGGVIEGLRLDTSEQGETVGEAVESPALDLFGSLKRETGLRPKGPGPPSPMLSPEELPNTPAILPQLSPSPTEHRPFSPSSTPVTFPVSGNGTGTRPFSSGSGLTRSAPRGFGLQLPSINASHTGLSASQTLPVLSPIRPPPEAHKSKAGWARWGPLQIYSRVFVNMYELRGGSILDLLRPRSKPPVLLTVERREGKVRVRGSTTVAATSPSDLAAVIVAGIRRSHPRPRWSHVILRITVEVDDRMTGVYRIGRLLLTDLATPQPHIDPVASERQQVEMEDANLSLEALHQVLKALASAAPNIRYGSHVLTQLLAEGLCQDKALLLSHIGATDSNLDEVEWVLRYASHLRDARLKALR